MKSERDKFPRRIRREARDYIWAREDRPYLADLSDRQEHFAERLAWDNRGGGYSPLDAAFHHKDGRAPPDRFDIATAFRGLYMKQVS